MSDTDDGPPDGVDVEVNPGGTETFWGCLSCQTGNEIDRTSCHRCGWRRGELVDIITGDRVQLEDVERLTGRNTMETYTDRTNRS